MRTRDIFAAAAVAWLGLAGASMAQTPPGQGVPPSILSPPVCANVDAAREAEDQRIVEAAMTAFNRGGYAALESHLRALRGVLDHAPACYPAIELRGDQIITRVPINMTAELAALIRASNTGESRTVVDGMNIYPTASLVMGAYYTEYHRYDDAIAWLDRGLALQPHDEFLAVEKATALSASRRPAEAAALLQSVLDDPDAAAISDRARLLRNLGVALIDLERFEDAEAALNESIRLQPNNPGARNELDYIAQLRAGGPRSPVTPSNAQETTGGK